MSKTSSITLLSTILMILSSCGGSPTSGDSQGSDVPIVSGSAVDDNEYDKWCDTWGQSGHLYLHYLRTDGTTVAQRNEYDNYAVWIWQNAPQDLEGSLWAASNSKVQENFYEMSSSWMNNIGNSGLNVDQSGAVCDIDLYKSGLLGGKTGRPTSFEGADRLGFLIVDQTSMGGGSHWTSDGGANSYISDFKDAFRANGSVHVFCTQGSVGDFKLSFDPHYTSNPVISDTTGQYVSKNDVSSSTSKYGVSSTSNDFKSLGVGYQIFVPSYRDSDHSGMGDIRGVTLSLSELDELGVDVLWLTPVQSSESYHGYDVVDYYTIDEKFGTLYDYQELIYEAHKKGIKVMMDLVLNHTSKNNRWFKKSQKAEIGYDEYGNEIHYRDLYHWKYKGDKVQLFDSGSSSYKSVNVENHPDWYKDGESNYYYYGKFGSGMAELNYDCQATRNLTINLAKYWLSFGLDGFRLDAVKHIYMKDEVDNSGSDFIISDVGTRTYYDEEKMKEETVAYDYSSDMTKNVIFWKEFANELKSAFPACFLVGENFDGYGTRMASYYQALDSQFDFSLYYHDYEWIYGTTQKGSSFSTLQYAETYADYKGTGTHSVDGKNYPQGMRNDFINGAFTSNHDVDRAINHMDNNNSNITGTAAQIQKAKVHAASTILSPGLSWIYYGDELGMSGNTNKHIEKYQYPNNEDIWYRQPYKWGDDSYTPSYSFNGYTVEWDDYNKDSLKSLAQQKESSSDNDMYDVYKQLCAIKKEYGANSQYIAVDSGPNNIYQFEVSGSGKTFNIYINTGVDGGSVSKSVTGSHVWGINGADSQTGIIPEYGILVVQD